MPILSMEDVQLLDGITELAPEIQSPEVSIFHESLLGLIIGQDRAVRRMAEMYQIHHAGFAAAHKPLGILLFLGPTGTGKTRVVEAACQVLFGDSELITKVNCAEFQHSHEIAKLIGSPPGYLGHRETAPMLTQENLDRCHTDKLKLSFVLFDEIEKAHDALWQLLLGILDKATLTLGDNRRVDFTRTIVVMTSNLGAREMSELVGGGVGFSPKGKTAPADDVDQKIYRTAIEAARRKYSPEFMNRIDKVVVFRSLKEEHYAQILEIELRGIQERIMRGKGEKFIFKLTSVAKRFLLDEGIDYRYGARELKRTLERFLVIPMANLSSTGQIGPGDILVAHFSEELGKLIFGKKTGGGLINVDSSAAAATATVRVSNKPAPVSARPK